MVAPEQTNGIECSAVQSLSTFWLCDHRAQHFAAGDVQTDISVALVTIDTISATAFWIVSTTTRPPQRAGHYGDVSVEHKDKPAQTFRMKRLRMHLARCHTQPKHVLIPATDQHVDATGAPKARRCLLLAVASLVILTAASILLEGSSLADGNNLAPELSLAPTRIFNSTTGEKIGPLDWVEVDNYDEIPEVERFHQSLLHAACVAEENADAVIPWTLGTPGHQNIANGSASNGDVIVREDDPNLLEKLRQCPDVDIFLPRELRGSGYCEDGVAYTKYLESRLLPMWVFQIKLFDPQLNRDVDYFDLCPKTPVIFFNHYWDGLTDLPRWPTDKPVWLMPNIEMFELTATHYWRADVVLCKTQTCFDRVSKWFDQEGNSRGTKVFYTKHTSSDQANFARMVLGDASIRSKDFDNVTLLHTAGTSVWKGTVQVVDCWLSQDNLPPVDVYIGDEAFAALFSSRYNMRLRITRHPITLRRERLDPLSFARLVAESAFFLCPSEMEGYGHYMNQARASGAVVITTDVAPLNELISSDDMGFRIPVSVYSQREQFLGGTSSAEHALKGVEGMKARFKGGDVCSAVDRLAKDTTPEQRAQMGERARQQYHADTNFFARSMRELRASVRATARAHEAINATEQSASRSKMETKEAAPFNNLRQDSGA